MLVEIESFVNWLRRRNPQARTWRDYSYDLKQFAAAVGDRPPATNTFHDLDRFVAQQAERGFKPATTRSAAAWRPSPRCTPSCLTTTRTWSAPSCRTGIG
jgi:site-specific recombinase XerD